MQKQLSLSVSKPCSEKWDSFSPTATGGFCSSCSKNVIDFTKMSDAEVIEYFKSASSNTCGRFRKDQLRTYPHQLPSTPRTGYKWLQTGLLSAALVFISKETSLALPNSKAKTEIFDTDGKKTESSMSTAEGYIVSGVVTYEDNELLPGVNIILKGTEIGTVTDIEGRFKFPAELREGDVLVFSFIGFKTEEYTIRKNSPEVLEINMLMDVQILGEVAVGGAYTAQPSGLAGVWYKIKNLF
ncbi:carboxypeptidase-like regulatory domain-containing protein [Fulvivirga kasyanovii]|uniref:Carboxypeptidase-like regulatory domain-containing protein n=1 Tax=Fulvivirga kasyanovii TaxID=396812 RepID=A0ABW9RR54_9BACT|nr:carboxypeptidase-like regulatory domain-containing protein [Fulvivirga kasyanovii]MTI25520.1 hypothetical protein [Fulvivirga kasyanovii]